MDATGRRTQLARSGPAGKNKNIHGYSVNSSRLSKGGWVRFGYGEFVVENEWEIMDRLTTLIWCIVGYSAESTLSSLAACPRTTPRGRKEREGVISSLSTFRTARNVTSSCVTEENSSLSPAFSFPFPSFCSLASQ